jgi:hypothetical protein
MKLPHDGVGKEQAPDLGPFQFVSGSVAGRMNVAKSAASFYNRLRAVRGWQRMPGAQAIQAALSTSESGFFAKWLGPATLLVATNQNAPTVMLSAKAQRSL